MASVFLHKSCLCRRNRPLYRLCAESKPLSLQYLTWRQSGAEADVRVDVRAGIVAVRVEHPSVGSVVPVATAVEKPHRSIPHVKWIGS